MKIFTFEINESRWESILKWKNILIFFLILFFLTTVNAGGNMYLNTDENSDISILAHAESVESKLIGEEGIESKQTNSFIRLNKKENRDKFIKLYNESRSIHGKIYALVWFFDNDRTLYMRYKNELNRNENVTIYHGDVKLISPLSDIFPLIESNTLKDHILH